MHSIALRLTALLTLAGTAVAVDLPVRTAAELEAVALRARPDDRILLAPGVYELTSVASPTIRLPSGVDLIGPSWGQAVITRSAATSNAHRASGALLGTSGGDTIIQNVHFVGVPSDIGRRETAINLSSLSGAGVVPLRARVYRCRFDGFATGLNLQGAGNYSYVYGCSFDRCDEAVFAGHPGRFHECEFRGADGERAFWASPYEGVVRITSCVFLGEPGSTLYEALYGSLDEVTLSGNVFHGARPPQ